MSTKRVLILGLLILAPILVFIFISTFGEHHFSLKTYFPEVDDAGEVITTAEGDTIFKKIPNFELVSEQGETFTKENLQGKVYVADFFFATCPGICKKMSSQLVRVQEAFQNDSTVKIVSFTVNPEHDSSQVLKNYADMYGADPEKWTFLTGPREEIYSLARNGFYLPVMKVEGQQDFIHSEKFMLVDKNHHVRGIYDGTDPVDVDRLITEIRVLLDDYSKTK
jgi:protein SCO1